MADEQERLHQIKMKKHTMLFYSSIQASMTIPAVAGNQPLPSVTIPSGALPDGAIIDEVYCHFLFGSIKDTSGADNKLSGSQSIQVKETAAGSYTNAITFVDDSLSIDVSEGTVRGSGAVYGNIDVSAEVDGEDTYDFQWTSALCDGASLIVYDVQCVIEVRYH